LLDFELIEAKRYEFASQLINGVGVDLGGRRIIKKKRRELTPPS
jgi:hypothetical protein